MSAHTDLDTDYEEKKLGSYVPGAPMYPMNQPIVQQRETVTGTTQSRGMSAHRKGKALLIALVNLNIIFLISIFHGGDIQLAGQMITAILFLVGVYVGTQGGIDMISEYRSNNSNANVNTNNKSEIVTKKYEYKMDYADGK